jgi:hypothetical protein
MKHSNITYNIFKNKHCGSITHSWESYDHDFEAEDIQIISSCEYFKG